MLLLLKRFLVPGWLFQTKVSNVRLGAGSEVCEILVNSEFLLITPMTKKFKRNTWNFKKKPLIIQLSVNTFNGYLYITNALGHSDALSIHRVYFLPNGFPEWRTNPQRRVTRVSSSSLLGNGENLYFCKLVSVSENQNGIL